MNDLRARLNGMFSRPGNGDQISPLSAPDVVAPDVNPSSGPPTSLRDRLAASWPSRRAGSAETDSASRRRHPGPTVTAFDFLDGAFVKVARARIARLALIAAVLAGVLGVALQAFTMTVEAGNANEQRRQAEAQLPALRAQIAQEANTGVITKAQIDRTMSELGRGVEQAVFTDAPIVEILTELRTTLPQSSVLQSVTLDPQTEGQHRTIQVRTSTSGYAALEDLRAALQASEMTTDVAVIWSGSGDALSVTATVTLAADVVTQRATTFLEDYPAPLGSAARRAAAAAAAGAGQEAP